MFQGYAAQLSVLYDDDEPSIHYDDNGFLVRPAPVGSVVSDNAMQPHSVHATCLGWTGDGTHRARESHQLLSARHWEGTKNEHQSPGAPLQLTRRWPHWSFPYDRTGCALRVRCSTLRGPQIHGTGMHAAEKRHRRFPRVCGRNIQPMESRRNTADRHRRESDVA